MHQQQPLQIVYKLLTLFFRRQLAHLERLLQQLMHQPELLQLYQHLQQLFFQQLPALLQQLLQ